jgi:hypothetical protein
MNTLRSLLFRTLVPVSFATICVYLTYAKEGPALVPIAVFQIGSGNFDSFKLGNVLWW